MVKPLDNSQHYRMLSWEPTANFVQSEPSPNNSGQTRVGSQISKTA